MKSSRLSNALLTEAARASFVADASLADDPTAIQAAISAKATHEDRLTAWSKALPISTALRANNAKVIAALHKFYIFSLLVIALISASSTALLMSVANKINVSHLLAAQLLLPLITLLIWLGWSLTGFLRKPNPNAVYLTALKPIARWTLRRTQSLALQPSIESVLSVYSRADLGYWTRSFILHGLWVAALAGALICSIFVLMFRQFDFTWETSLLSQQSLVALLQGLAWLPQKLHLSVPNWNQALDAANSETRQIWAKFILNCIVIYGLAPRALAMLFSRIMAYFATRKSLLDFNHPHWVEIWVRLNRHAPVESKQLGAAAPSDQFLNPPRLEKQAQKGSGDFVALICLEPEQLNSARLISDRWTAIDLGLINSRSDLQRVCSDQASLPSRPLMLIVFCSLVRTPDRGATAILQQINQAFNEPILVVLTDADLHAKRGGDVELRSNSWRDHAHRAGIQAVILAEVESILNTPRDAIEAHISNQKIQDASV